MTITPHENTNLEEATKLIAEGKIVPDRELLFLVEEYAKRQRTNKINTIFPDKGLLRRELYPKHIEFITAGARYNERCLLAANRSGKSFVAAYEAAAHLTLDYPHWWQGKKFNKGIHCWAAGTTTETARDIPQFLLLGPSNAIGTGMIPKDRIVRTFPNPDLSNGISEAWIKNNLGDISKIAFKSYMQHFETYQGTEQDFIWLDEEPPMSIYTECLIRTMTVNGLIVCTFTPLRGLSEVVLAYLPGGQMVKDDPNKFVMQLGWNDAPHLTKEQKEKILASTPIYQRDARSKGIPQLGVGAIYPIPEDFITCEPFTIPAYWPRAYALDVGWKKTAALWGAYNVETDTWYLYDEYYRGEVETVIHAAAVKARGKWIRGVVDPAAGASNVKDGSALLNIYETLGLKLSSANNAVEAGIQVVFERLSTGRLKIFSTCFNWFNEYRIYRRSEEKNGNVKVVKANDHLMDATRYLIMSGMEVATTERRANYAIQLQQDSYSRFSGANTVTGY